MKYLTLIGIILLSSCAFNRPPRVYGEHWHFKREFIGKINERQEKIYLCVDDYPVARCYQIYSGALDEK